mgnify:CR=1 FL=1
MNNKHSSCARNRNENRTVIFYARKHGMAPPARPAGVAGRSGVAPLRSGDLVFLLYDWGLSRLIGMMTARLKLR